MRRLPKGSKGQAAVEYILIVALTGLACLGAAVFFREAAASGYERFVFMMMMPFP
mgnify:CR=1 FL=1